MLASAHAAIDHINTTGTITALITGKKQHEPGDFLNCAITPERYSFYARLARLFLVAGRAARRGLVELVGAMAVDAGGLLQMQTAV